MTTFVSLIDDEDGLREVDLHRLEALAAALQREIARRQGAVAPLPTLSRLERQHVLRALELARGNKKAAAEMLGVSRRAFYRRLERLSLGETIARRPAPAPRHASAHGPAQVAHA